MKWHGGNWHGTAGVGVAQRECAWIGGNGTRHGSCDRCTAVVSVARRVWTWHKGSGRGKAGLGVARTE
jgi:hypothetical protein